MEGYTKAVKWFCVVFVSMLFLAACVQDRVPQSTESVGNGYELSLLFEAEGCKVYRFRDSDEYIYLSTCPGRTSYETSCGKNCTNDVSNETVENEL